MISIPSQHAQIDLHCHSTASDGFLPPAELVAHAAAHNIALLALTDHDTVAGLSAAAGGAVAAGFHTITAIGVAAEGLSARSRTRADTRYWHRLPDGLHLATLRHAPDGGPLHVRFLDEHGQPLAGADVDAAVHFDDRGNGLAFASHRPAQHRSLKEGTAP